MKLLLLGRDGQLGWELQRALSVLGHLTALGREGDGVLAGDLRDPEGLLRTLDAVAPDVIVNAAAYTAVDRAESDVEAAFAVNAEAPALLAQEAAARGAWLVHYSTDYVFDGSGDTPWVEDAPTGPLSVYGRSKLGGEEAVRASGCRHLVFRTSWVYASRGHNFAKTMLRLARERDELRVVSDQFGAPTGADLLADVTAHALRRALVSPELAGTYHAAASGETNWWEYACFAIEQAREHGAPLRVGRDAVLPVTTEAFPTAAQRPRNSRLATGKLAAAFDLRLPPWRDGVARMIAEELR